MALIHALIMGLIAAAANIALWWVLSFDASDPSLASRLVPTLILTTPCAFAFAVAFDLALFGIKWLAERYLNSLPRR